VVVLEDLLQTETMWRDLLKSSKYDSHKIVEIFPKECVQFMSAYEKGFFPKPCESKRRKSVRGS